MIKSMAEDKTGEWIAANCLPDCLFIRPSGNPFKAAEFVTFFGGDVEITEKALIKIQKLDVGADMAYATASESAKFTRPPVHGHGQRHVVVGRLRVMTRPAPVARPRLPVPHTDRSSASRHTRIGEAT